MKIWGKLNIHWNSTKLSRIRVENLLILDLEMIPRWFELEKSMEFERGGSALGEKEKKMLSIWVLGEDE